MRTPGDRFIKAFNDIEIHFKSAAGAKPSARFAEVARTCAKQNKLPAAQLDALLSFGMLRNAIAHGRYYNGRPIAEPVSEVVEEIERLRKQVMTPRKVLEVLEPKQVCFVHPDDHIAKALEYVRRFDYSQIPVYDEAGYLGILTTNSIARWLAQRLASQDALQSAPVREVLTFSELTDQAALVDSSMTAAEAVDTLHRSESGQAPVSALIITENGLRTDTPLRVVVLYNLAALTAALAFR